MVRLAFRRHSLSYGGDDITAFLAVLLQESHFPHKELDMATSYDWRTIEGLKERFCTLSEVCQPTLSTGSLPC